MRSRCHRWPRQWRARSRHSPAPCPSSPYRPPRVRLAPAPGAAREPAAARGARTAPASSIVFDSSRTSSQVVRGHAEGRTQGVVTAVERRRKTADAISRGVEDQDLAVHPVAPAAAPGVALVPPDAVDSRVAENGGAGTPAGVHDQGLDLDRILVTRASGDQPRQALPTVRALRLDRDDPPLSRRERIGPGSPSLARASRPPIADQDEPGGIPARSLPAACPVEMPGRSERGEPPERAARHDPLGAVHFTRLMPRSMSTAP